MWGRARWLSCGVWLCVSYWAAALGESFALWRPKSIVSIIGNKQVCSHTRTRAHTQTQCTEDYDNPGLIALLGENHICHYQPLSPYLPLKYSWLIRSLDILAERRGWGRYNGREERRARVERRPTAVMGLVNTLSLALHINIYMKYGSLDVWVYKQVKW